MADAEVQIPDPSADVEMGGEEEGDGGAEVVEEETMLPDVEVETKRESFLDFLKSPIIELAVGIGENETILTAHQALLIKSPYFQEACARFGPDEKRRRIDLPDEDLSAVGSVLEYLYNDEYFPKRLAPSAKDSALEADPSVPSPDNTGAALLKHARIYTLAEKFRLPSLKSLAHSKIHRTNSTARGEIAYARYVYKETSRDDQQIRKPVAAFWATRSHVLRHEAEEEFRTMCLEFPQFSFDVLSLVLDQKEKGKVRGGAEEAESSRGVTGTPVVHSGRKRQRTSGI
ncbi:hypothetical protein NA57DRAFT_47229 [Rhizodiscina lignyota]|uniref:BTB domain-containing protein n=1 Tax=Rhizodiscina lignyota TaxID=1504668 RepID=A0A9P4I3I7_9PEZI|nr:hypothetical protein NA57DRAFT_47229 [Rhizodiscina lignyota]